MLIVLAASSPVASAGHRSGELGLPGVSERQLRAFETRVLGPAHAAEHARMRRALAQGPKARTEHPTGCHGRRGRSAR